MKRKMTLVTMIAAMLVLAMAGVGSAATYEQWTFDDPDLSAWYTDRKEPSKFETKYFDGDNRLYMEHDGNAQANEEFYYTEGKKKDVNINMIGTYMSIDMYVDPAWNYADTPEFAEQRRFDIWGTVSDAGGNKLYPIIGYAHTLNQSGNDIALEGFQVYDHNADGWMPVMDLSADDSLYGTWVNLKVEFLAGSFKYYINEDLVYTDSTTGGAVTLNNAIIQGKNYDGNQSYGVYFDNFKVADVPEPMTMSLLGLGGLVLARRKKA